VVATLDRVAAAASAKDAALGSVPAELDDEPGDEAGDEDDDEDGEESGVVSMVARHFGTLSRRREIHRSTDTSCLTSLAQTV
jgi:hypothetical protein